MIKRNITLSGVEKVDQNTLEVRVSDWKKYKGQPKIIPEALPHTEFLPRPLRVIYKELLLQVDTPLQIQLIEDKRVKELQGKIRDLQAEILKLQRAVQNAGGCIICFKHGRKFHKRWCPESVWYEENDGALTR